MTVHRIPDVQWNTWSVNVTTWEVAQPLLLSVAPGTWRFAVQMARPAIVDFHCSFLLVNCREGVKKRFKATGQLGIDSHIGSLRWPMLPHESL